MTGSALAVDDALALGTGPPLSAWRWVSRAPAPAHPDDDSGDEDREGRACDSDRAARGVKRMPFSVSARIGHVDERAAQLVSTWLEGLSPDGRRTLYTLLDELCSGLDVSRHNPSLPSAARGIRDERRAFRCTLPELRDAVAASLGSHLPPDRPRSALESLRDEISSRGHPDFR